MNSPITLRPEWVVFAAALLATAVAGCFYTQRGKDPKTKRIVWAATVMSSGLFLSVTGFLVLNRIPAFFPLMFAVPLAITYRSFAVCSNCGSMNRKATPFGKVLSCSKCGAASSDCV